MEGLPAHWPTAPLNDVAKVQSGGTPSRGVAEYWNGKIPWVKISDIDSVYVTKTDEFITEEGLKNSSARIFPKGTILLTIFATIGRVGILKIDAATNQAIAGITPLKQVEEKFFYYALIHYANKLVDQAKGVAQKNINLSILKALEIPLPPYGEQKRIVAKLDTMFGHLDQLKARLENIPVLLKQFRQAVLTQAVTGKLTEEWRERNKTNENAVKLLERIKIRRTIEYNDLLQKAKVEGKRKPSKRHLLEIPEISDGKTTEIPDSWTLTNIDFLAYVTKLAGFEYSEHINFETSGEIPVVRAQNVQMGHFVEENLVYISKETSDFLERSQLHGREILMVFIGAGTGNVCMAPSDKRWHLAPNVAKIDVDGISSEYLYLYLQSPIGLENMNSFIKATAQPSLSMETIRQIVVQLPPLAEQKEIVRRVESLLALADRIEVSYNSLLEKIDYLPQAILAKAFRGELSNKN
jgi:type I restriction enzyme, S subunit